MRQTWAISASVQLYDMCICVYIASADMCFVELDVMHTMTTMQFLWAIFVLKIPILGTA